MLRCWWAAGNLGHACADGSVEINLKVIHKGNLFVLTWKDEITKWETRHTFYASCKLLKIQTTRCFKKCISLKEWGGPRDWKTTYFWQYSCRAKWFWEKKKEKISYVNLRLYFMFILALKWTWSKVFNKIFMLFNIFVINIIFCSQELINVFNKPQYIIIFYWDLRSLPF